MESELASSREPFNYGVGSLMVLVLSVGLFLIVYGGNFLAFDILNLPAWILGPVGIYTLVFSLVRSKESSYYLVWGTILTGVSFASAFYKIVTPYVVFGILIIIIAIIGLFAYVRRRT